MRRSISSRIGRTASTPLLDLLAERSQVIEVIASIDDITQRFFGRAEGESARPSEGFASSSTFDPATSASARLQESYESTMPELYVGSEPLPTWGAICERVGRPAIAGVAAISRASSY